MAKSRISTPDRNSADWEKRSRKYGASLKSVLFKGMPDVVNEHFHRSHLDFIFGCLAETKKNIRILDSGCGYGRLSLPLIKAFPEADISGMDVSHHYVKLYQKITGRKAFVGRLEFMPEGVGKFDCIVAMAVLMYIERELTAKAISNLLDHLNSGGKLIIIEPSASGTPCQTAFGLLKILHMPSSATDVNTGGYCFQTGEIDRLIERGGATIVKEERIPATTLAFLPIYLMGKMLPAKGARLCLRCISTLDRLLKDRKLPTLWTYHLAIKR